MTTGEFRVIPDKIAEDDPRYALQRVMEEIRLMGSFASSGAQLIVTRQEAGIIAADLHDVRIQEQLQVAS